MEPIPNGAGVGGQSYRSETSLSGERSGWDEFALRNNRIFYREVQNLSHAPPQAELRGLERTPRFLNPQAMVFARKSEKHSPQGACAYLFIIHFFAAPDTPSLPSAAALPRLLLAYTSLPMARVSTVGRLVLAWVYSRLGAWENLSKSDILSESDILEDRLSAGTGLRDAGRRASFDERCRQHPPAETFSWRLSDR